MVTKSKTRSLPPPKSLVVTHNDPKHKEPNTMAEALTYPNWLLVVRDEYNA